MRALLVALGVGACTAAVLAAGALASACLNEDEQNTLIDVPFDGSSLGSCTNGATKKIGASRCPAECSGNGALAVCVGSSYSLCSCEPSTATTCDSGCCRGPNYQPTPCVGMSAVPDPSEGLCDADEGYLLCNGTCLSSFVCELPPGYTVLPGDGGVEAGDAGIDAAHDASKDGAREGSPDGEAGAGDGAAEAGADGSSDGPVDGPTDAPREAKGKGDK